MTHLKELEKLKIKDSPARPYLNKDNIDKIIKIIIDAPEEDFIENGEKCLGKIELLQQYFIARNILKGNNFEHVKLKLWFEN